MHKLPMGAVDELKWAQPLAAPHVPVRKRGPKGVEGEGEKQQVEVALFRLCSAPGQKVQLQDLSQIDTGVRPMTASQDHLKQLARAAPCQTAAVLSAVLITQHKVCAANHHDRKGG